MKSYRAVQVHEPLQVWLRQHGLEGSSDDLGMGVITAFAAHLVETAAIVSAASNLSLSLLKLAHALPSTPFSTEQMIRAVKVW